MSNIEYFINLTKLANEAGCRGDERELEIIKAKRSGFADAWEMFTGVTMGRLFVQADLAMMEIYGEVPMCAGILNEFPPNPEAGLGVRPANPANNESESCEGYHQDDRTVGAACPPNPPDHLADAVVGSESSGLLGADVGSEMKS